MLFQLKININLNKMIYFFFKCYNILMNLKIYYNKSNLLESNSMKLESNGMTIQNLDPDLDVIKYLNEKSCNYIIDLLTSENLIGKGFWGAVYKFDIKGHKISVKIQPISNDKKYNPNLIDPRNIELEIDLLKKLSQYKIINSFIHFPYFYKELKCSNEKLIFYEYYTWNLKQFFKTKYTFEDFKMIVSQILVSIYFFQQITNHYHNDIHVENFLLNELKEPIEQKYSFLTLGFDKTFIFSKYYISIWDFANAIPINKTNNSKTENIDYIQFKNMFHRFTKYLIDSAYDSNTIYKFCLNTDPKYNFTQYFKKEIKMNKLKWSYIKNDKVRELKIVKSVTKSFIYWIIENKLVDKFVLEYNMDPFQLPSDDMLTWIDNLPNTLEQAIKNI